jgi:hypothetical protein
MSPQERDARSVNEWVLVHHKSDASIERFIKELEIGVSGEHFIGFIYIDAQAGMTLSLEAFCTLEGETITITKTRKDYNAGMRIRYSVYSKDFEFSILNDTQRIALNLPKVPDWLHIYQVEGQAEIDRLRKIELLHPLRAPGFPDDILFVLVPTRSEIKPEGVWGRLISNPQEGLFVVKLLVKPYEDFGGITIGDYLVVEVKPTPQGISSVCIGKASPKTN